jgi:hypothetical protein
MHASFQDELWECGATVLAVWHLIKQMPKGWHRSVLSRRCPVKQKIILRTLE